MGGEFGLPYQQILFMMGKELRGIGDRRVLDTYMKLIWHPRTLTDQKYVPRKQKVVKPAIKWKVPANKPKGFKFSADTNHSKPPWKTNTGGLIFKSGNTKAEETPEEPKPYSSSHNFVFRKANLQYFSDHC